MNSAVVIARLLLGRVACRRATRAAALVGLVSVACNGRVANETRSDGGVADSTGTGPSAASTGTGAGPASASSDSKCGATPVQLVDFNILAAQIGGVGITGMQIAVDATNVYFVYGGALMRVPIHGGAASSMAPVTPEVGQNCDPLVTSTSVLLHHTFAGSSNDEQVLSVPIDGGQPTVLATSSGFVRGLATDGHDVYFVDSAGIKSVGLTGGSVQVLSGSIGTNATGLAVIGANVVATANDTVVAVPVAGGSTTTLAPSQPNAQFPMACGPDTCWWTGAPPAATGPEGPGYIARLHDGSVTTVSAPVYPWSLVFDGSNFFETVGCDVCSGSLVRIAPSGTPPVMMTSGTFVAVDDECAYFSVVEGFGLPSMADGGIPGSGIYSVEKSFGAAAAAGDAGESD